MVVRNNVKYLVVILFCGIFLFKPNFVKAQNTTNIIFTTLDGKIQNVNARVSALEAKLEATDSKISALDSKLSSLSNAVKTLAEIQKTTLKQEDTPNDELMQNLQFQIQELKEAMIDLKEIQLKQDSVLSRLMPASPSLKSRP